MMLVGLERLKDLDVIRMTQSLKNANLVHDLFLLAFFLHEVHVDRFDGAQLTRQPMQSQVDLAECAFTEHLADLVQLELRLWRLLVLAEAVEDQLANEINLLGSRRQMIRLAIIVLYVVQYVVMTHGLTSFLRGRAILLLSRLLINHTGRCLVFLNHLSHIVMRLVLIEALSCGELAELTQLDVGVRHYG